MRKLLIIVSLFIVVAAALVGGTVPVRAENLRIAMVLWRGETPAETGFKDALKKLGYTVEYTVVNADQNRTTLRSRIEKTIMPRLDSFDYVYSFGTTASKMIKLLVRDRVPHLFNIVTDPVKAGIVRSMSEPGGNVGGASQFVPLSAQIQAALKLFEIRKLGLLFNPREKNAMIQREQIYRMAEKYRFEVIDLRSPPAQDMLERNLQNLADNSVKVDAVYLPFDSFLISKAKLIGSTLRAAKIKSIGATKAYISGGALMGVVPDYRKLGEAVAEILHRHRKGEKLERIPVSQIYRTQAPTLMVNETTRAAIGLHIPQAVLSKAVIVK